MIAPNDIADALEGLVRQAFPGEEVYRGQLPSGFQPPGTLIVQDEGKVFPNFGCGAVEMQVRFTLTTFAPPDEPDQSRAAALQRRQMKLAGLLLPGHVRVGDRTPRIGNELTLGTGQDSGSVTATFHYCVGREAFRDVQQQPEMRELNFKQEVNNYG